MRTFLCVVSVVYLVLLSACGDVETLSMAPGCQFTTVEGGVEVACPGQEVFTLANGRDGKDGRDGADGQDGKDGTDGKDGHAALVAQLPAGAECPAGGVVLLTAIDADDDLVLEPTDWNVQSATLCNGTAAPVSPFTPVAVVDPCGTAPGIHNEVFFRLQNRSLVGSFSDDAQGNNTRFAFLAPGTYITTDGDRCVFTVDQALDIVNESHRSGP